MASVMRFDQWQDSNGVPIFNASGGVAPSGFTASTTITASNSSWPVPALKSPIVKVTVIGGGGGGGAAVGSAGGQGGTTTFNAGGAGSVSAVGGLGGRAGRDVGTAGTLGLASANGGQGGSDIQSGGSNTSQAGNGGVISVAYFNLSGISTVDITIGAGGIKQGQGADGGRGEVIVEYVAA
jgi:hypothetical protein